MYVSTRHLKKEKKKEIARRLQSTVFDMSERAESTFATRNPLMMMMMMMTMTMLMMMTMMMMTAMMMKIMMTTMMMTTNDGE